MMVKSQATDAPALANRRRHLLINHNFALLWYGQTISLLGDFIFNTTLVVWIAIVLAKGQTWTPLAVSSIFLASSLPTILLGPLAGVFVDRWNKQKVLRWSTFLQALCVALLLIQISVARQIGVFGQLMVIYLVVFLLNTCSQFARPAWLALTARIVTQGQQSQAIGLDQASTSLGMLVGPLLAPPLLLALGPQWALLINLLSFLLSALTLFLMRVPQEERLETGEKSLSILAEFQIGANFLFNTRLLRIMLILSVISWFGGGALYALDIFFVTQNLHTLPVLYGILDTALAIGTIVGAILAGTLGERFGLTRLLWGATLALGVTILIYARLTSFVPALILTFLIGVPFASLAVVSGPLMLRVTPQELLGRVSSLFNPCSTLATLLGSTVAGFIASALVGHFHFSFLNMSFGPVDTIFTGTGVLLLIGGFYAMLNLRDTDVNASTSVEAADA